MKIISRHHLRSDAVDEIETALAEGLDVELDADTYELVELEDTTFDVVLVDGEPDVLYYEGEPFLSVRGANAHSAEEGVVTVDAGAVSFVSNGADVMRPGIVEANERIKAGDLVVIVEESHGKALAVGRALVDGDEMTGDSGKVVESLHHVGDAVYAFSV
jgi:PUA domain protein